MNMQADFRLGRIDIDVHPILQDAVNRFKKKNIGSVIQKWESHPTVDNRFILTTAPLSDTAFDILVRDLRDTENVTVVQSHRL